MTATAIIRQRGQLTIPEAIRRACPWIKTGAVVTITLESPDKIVITPYKSVVK